MAELHVDDRQPLVGEDHVRADDLDAGVIGPTVVQALQRRGDRFPLMSRRTGVADKQEHSTHGRHPFTG